MCDYDNGSDNDGSDEGDDFNRDRDSVDYMDVDRVRC